MKRTSEAAFETAIEAILLGEGYTRADAKGFDRERAIFPDEVLAFIRATQGKGVGEAGGAARRADRCAGTGIAVQVVGHARRPSHPKPRLQVVNRESPLEEMIG